MIKRQTEWRDMLLTAKTTARSVIRSLSNPLDRRLLEPDDYAQEAVMRMFEVEKTRILIGSRKAYLNSIVTNLIREHLRKRELIGLAFELNAEDTRFQSVDENETFRLQSKRQITANTRSGLVSALVIETRHAPVEITHEIIGIALGCSKEAARKHVERASISAGRKNAQNRLSEWMQYREAINSWYETGVMRGFSISEQGLVRLSDHLFRVIRQKKQGLYPDWWYLRIKWFSSVLVNLSYGLDAHFPYLRGWSCLGIAQSGLGINCQKSVDALVREATKRNAPSYLTDSYYRLRDILGGR